MRMFFLRSRNDGNEDKIDSCPGSSKNQVESCDINDKEDLIIVDQQSLDVDNDAEVILNNSKVQQHQLTRDRETQNIQPKRFEYDDIMSHLHIMKL